MISKRLYCKEFFLQQKKLYPKIKNKYPTKHFTKYKKIISYHLGIYEKNVYELDYSEHVKGMSSVWNYGM